MNLWTGTWVVTNITHKKEIPKVTIFLNYTAFVIFSEYEKNMRKNKPKQSLPSSSFAVARPKQNQTLNEKNNWGSKWLSLGHKNIYQPLLAGKD